MAVRLRDIADDLNLSTMTISKVLSGQTDVSAATKARVLKRVKELNYRPNTSARGLRTGQTFNIGMVVPSLFKSSVAEIAFGLNEVFRAAEYSLVLSSADSDAETEEREIELHLSRQVDALLFCLREDAADIPQALKNTSIPFLVLGHCPPKVSVHSVGPDDFEVGYLAAKHLIDRRSKRIAYLRGGRTAVADQQFAGYLKAMRDGGIAVRHNWLLEVASEENAYRQGREAANKVLMQRPRPDAILGHTDFLASAARDAALAMGISVPEQLQIIGAGNQAMVCEGGLSLSSVDPRHTEVGRRAARLALRLIEKKERAAARSVMVAPVVVQRDSTRKTT